MSGEAVIVGLIVAAAALYLVLRLRRSARGGGCGCGCAGCSATSRKLEAYDAEKDGKVNSNPACGCKKS